MSGKTRAIEVLDRSGVPFTIHEYQVGDTDPSYGEAVADAINVDAGRVFKTLVATVDGDPIVAIVPVSGRLSLKRLAKAAGGKRAGMADPATAQRRALRPGAGRSPAG